MARAKLKIKVKKGALHRQLGVKQGTPISAFKLAQAKHSKNALTRKRATFAINAKKWNHGGRK
jgi:hypothetical protein